MKDMKMTCCKLCGREFNRLSSHVRKTHSIEFETYLVAHEFDGVRPLCECGCGEEAPFTRSQGESFKRYVHGHAVRGHVVSTETRCLIGEKNSVNMKRYLAENPETVKQRVKNMKSGRTDESEERRLLACIESWKDADERRAATSERAVKMWSEQRSTMEAGVAKARETFRDNHEAGLHVVGTPEWRDKISKSISQKYLDGGFEWSRGVHVSSKMLEKGQAYYRSSWELRHMLELDNDDNVESYRYEPFWMLYEFDGQKHRYLPDFLVTFVDGHRELHEIGVKSLKDGMSINLAKQAAARQLCSEKGWMFRLVSF